MNTVVRKSTAKYDHSPWIIVTGGSRGIGKALVGILLANGYKVINLCRTADLQDNTSTLINVTMDLACTDSIDLAVSRIAPLLKESGLFALINNAGYGLQVSLEDVSPNALSHQLQVNVIGTVHLTNLLIPFLIEHKRSRLVFMSSVLGFSAIPFRGPYSMSKFALEAASDTYRLELNNTGCKVVVVQPGPVRTDFKRSALFKCDEVIAKKGRSRLDYSDHIKRLASAWGKASVSADDVAMVVLDAIQGETPKTRYRVGLQTHIARLIKLLPTGLQDYIARKAEPVRLASDPHCQQADSRAANPS